MGKALDCSGTEKLRWDDVEIALALARGDCSGSWNGPGMVLEVAIQRTEMTLAHRDDLGGSSRDGTDAQRWIEMAWEVAREMVLAQEMAHEMAIITNISRQSTNDSNGK